MSRDQVAQATNVSRALAAFHLDKLVREGLLDVCYRRLSGRTGPGAGRPSKLYRQSTRQLHVSVPPRDYELAAQLFAQALEGSGSHSLNEVACAYGIGLGERAGKELSGRNRSDRAMHTLATHGFQPERQKNGDIVLRNCPFYALAQVHRTLVCTMNHALVRGVITGLEMENTGAILDPHPDTCCVRLTGTTVQTAQLRALPEKEA